MNLVAVAAVSPEVVMLAGAIGIACERNPCHLVVRLAEPARAVDTGHGFSPDLNELASTATGVTGGTSTPVQPPFPPPPYAIEKALGKEVDCKRTSEWAKPAQQQRRAEQK